MIKNQYIPYEAVHPGRLVEEYIECACLPLPDFAERMGITLAAAERLLAGEERVTPALAAGLSRVIGRPARLWSNLQEYYEETKLRLESEKEVKAGIAWLKTIPLDAMAKRGYMRKLRDKNEQLEETLRFFAIASHKQFGGLKNHYHAAFRRSSGGKRDSIATLAWLRRGEILAIGIRCGRFSKAKFRAALKEARSLSGAAFEEFKDKLTSQCAAAGVAVVVVPELPGTGIAGATHWLKDKPVIQLSDRYKTNDQFWFSFFHEAGHIMRHGRELFVEGIEGLNKQKESEADEFARALLIPPSAYRSLIRRGDYSAAAVRAFAEKIGIAPGIVIGRLQHDGYCKPRQGNDLKLPFRYS